MAHFSLARAPRSALAGSFLDGGRRAKQTAILKQTAKIVVLTCGVLGFATPIGSTSADTTVWRGRGLCVGEKSTRLRARPGQSATRHPSVKSKWCTVSHRCGRSSVDREHLEREVEGACGEDEGWDLGLGSRLGSGLRAG